MKKNPTRKRLPTERAATQDRPSENSFRHAETVRRLLLSDYDAGNRDLPWRGETDPYRIWVSEVMLQQTRVETVAPYYVKWLERFPDIDSLALATEDEVLRAWQGLGYYSRARRLHEGARVVRERRGGTLPENSQALRELPGIGEYTAGAVASIAFGEVTPAVDGNVKRVLSRLFDLPAPSPGTYRSLAAELVDPRRPGDFNQALMELGSLVCVPRSPRCDQCPLGSVCLALERGTVGERPAHKSKNQIPEWDEAVLVAVARDRYEGLHFLLRKRPDAGLLAGMWEFPGVVVPGRPAKSLTGEVAPASAEPTPDPFREPAAALAAELGLGRAPRLHRMETVTHVFSHLKAHYRPYLVQVPSAVALGSGPEAPQWVSEEDLGRVPLPVAQQKMLTLALAVPWD